MVSRVSGEDEGKKAKGNGRVGRPRGKERFVNMNRKFNREKPLVAKII